MVAGKRTLATRTPTFPGCLGPRPDCDGRVCACRPSAGHATVAFAPAGLRPDMRRSRLRLPAFGRTCDGRVCACRLSAGGSPRGHATDARACRGAELGQVEP